MDTTHKTVKYEQVLTGIDEDVTHSKQVNGRYVIPWGGQRPSFGAVFKWMFMERRERGIGNKEELKRNLPVSQLDKLALELPPPDKLQVTWLGHATVLVQLDGFNILTDPCLNTFCGPTKFLGKKRYRPPPCSVNELPVIDAVVISHNHYDHLDCTTVINLNQRFGDTLTWYVPMGLKAWMVDTGCNNVIDMNWWELKEHEIVKECNAPLKFIFTPSQHWSRRGLCDENKSLWGSWCVIGSKQKFFFAGDTGYHDEVFKQIGRMYGPFNLAAIPIGAYKPRWFLKFQHINPTEAVKIHEDVGSAMSIGIHWGTFPLGYEHYMAPPQDLKVALQEQGLEENSFITLNHGETRIIDTEDSLV